MNVPMSELESIGREVNVEVTDLNAFEFLHMTQKAGFFKMYPKPNARRKSVPTQKPEIAPGGTIGEWVEMDMVMTKRGPKYTPRHPERHYRTHLKEGIGNMAQKIAMLQKVLKDRGIDPDAELPENFTLELA